MIICITGMPGAGKTLVAEHLQNNGFYMIEMGDIVRKMMREEGLEINNVSLREYALKLREREGKDAVARRVVEMARSLDVDVIITGMRSTEELDYFKSKLHDIFTVAVVSPTEERFERLKKRGRKDDPKEHSEFDFREAKEVKYGIPGAVKSSEYVIFNTGTIKDLNASVDELLSLLTKKEKGPKGAKP